MNPYSITIKNLSFVLLILFSGKLKAQTFSLGLGVNTSLFVLDPTNQYPVPSLPFSPYLTLKINRHEVLAGPDLYMFKKNPDIFGGQLAYHYRLRKESRLFDPFFEANFQYVRFRTGKIIPEPYHSSSTYTIADGNLLSHTSFVNTYGLGLQLRIRETIRLYSVLGGGYNIRDQTVIQNGSGDYVPEGAIACLTGYIRLGASFYFCRKTNTSNP